MVKVVTLAPQQPLNVAAADDGIVFDPVNIPPAKEGSESEVAVHTYVWAKDPLKTLEAEIWSYETFVKDNLHKWVGTAANRASYEDVDKWREIYVNTGIQNGSAPDAPQSPSARIEQALRRTSQDEALHNNQNRALHDQQSIGNTNEYVFGHAMLKYFCFEDGYININNGPFTFCSLIFTIQPWHLYNIRHQFLIDCC